ncbi:unnamed protein product [marine sediment metagenome]|uniref:Uncharacterized protein n=1 Tax=marine sediment metagenome TaxID=412755 RepID=X1C6N6_9ZZZZ
MYYGRLAAWASFHGDFELALRARRRLGTTSWGTWAPLDAGVRKLPGFKDIVREAGLVDYWREFGWGYYCRPIGNDDFECE